MASAALDTGVRHLRELAASAMIKELTDQELLERFAANRDGAAFAALMRRHGRLVWGVYRQLRGHPGIAKRQAAKRTP